MKIGFIGLGNMGSGMVRNLLRYCSDRGHDLFVNDINKQVLEQFVSEGAIVCDSVSELSAQVNVLFTSLPSAKEIGLVAEGILGHLAPGSVWFETSTNELAAWQTICDRAPSDVTLVDAPVTGGAEGAAAGTLTMLLGVEQDLLNQHHAMLSSFTSKAVRMGPPGAGYVTKLCQLHLNYLVAQGIGETLMLGAKADLDLDVLHSVLMQSCAQSYVVDSYIPKVLDGSYDPSFTLGLATKDMRLISELGEHLSVNLPLADEVYKHYQSATESYGGEEPHLKIVKLIEDESNQLLRSSLRSRQK